MAPDRIQKRLKDYASAHGQIKIMEVCGTHTSSIFRNGIRSLLSDGIRLVSGPGCPVCVTPPSAIDALVSLAQSCEVLSFGDMFRVPGSDLSLAQAKAQGAQVRLMYSPFEVVALAKERPRTQFVVAAVGFETTAPVYAALLETLDTEDLRNVRLYTALKTMPEVLSYICTNEAVDAFLCPGHVSAIIGSAVYEPLCAEFKKPFVIAGFEAEQILAAIYEIIDQIDKGIYAVRNLYPSVVRRDGQMQALAFMARYFVQSDSFWRGIGLIHNSGLSIADQYARFSANEKDSGAVHSAETENVPQGCRCTDVMLGRINPDECPLFGTVCTPQHPAGACMVSAEGACGIWKNSGAGLAPRY
ncbi:MAG: hydrogenase formation protein HypD [Treponema sp.]|nr:hydrogenase formation protein HypD [Treponema sp.]